jgi:hypothetical protein
MFSIFNILQLTPTANQGYDADEDDEEEFTDSDDHEDNPFVEDRSLGYVIWLFGPTKALLLLPEN